MSEFETSRRRWLAGAGAAAAATVMPAPGSQGEARAAGGPAASGHYSTDVVVIGAGYAGLACARALLAAGKQVLVLEARDRVGGRCLNQTLPAPFNAYTVEGGAEFIGPTQDRMYALVKELGLSTFPAYATGKVVSFLGGSRTTYSGFLPTGNLIAAAEVGVAILKLESMAKQVPLDTPWTAAKAAEWDSQTAQTWIDANLLTRDGKSLLKLAVLALISTEPRDVSLLYLLHYIRSGGGLSSLLSTAGGAQQDRITGGSQLIAIRMAERLGYRIIHNAVANKVEQDGAGVTVTGGGFSVRAQRVVVAMAPSQAARIQFEPMNGLLANRQQLMQRVPMGAAWKMHAIYDKPFWRDDGLCGQVTSDAYLPKIVFDNTPPEAGAPGVLMAFIDGQDARDAELMTPAARRQAVVAALGVYFGSKALNPIGFTEKSWQLEAFSGGGPVGVFPPGVLTGYGAALRTPIGRLHWAGSETSTVWAGYMEGAVRSGERAAQEVLSA